MADWIQSITLAFKDSFTGGFKQATDAMEGMRQGMQEINNGSGLMSMARDLSVTASQTEPFREKLSAALNVPTQLASGLNSTFTNIKTVTGSSAEEMKKLEEQIIGIGGKSTAGLQATTNAFYDIAGGVSDASVRMSTLQAAISLSEAGQADLGASTKGLISIVNAYGFSAEKTGFASDVFTRTVGMGVGTMDEFVGAMSPLAGLTASSGISFDELGGAMAFMTTQGTSAAMSATQIKASVTSLMNPNKDMSKAIKESGFESGSAMIKQLGLVGALQRLNTTLGGSQDAMAQALGSTEAMQGAVALTKDGVGDFAKSYKEGLAGITEESRKVQLKSYAAKLGKLKSAQEEFQKKIGDSSIAIKGFGADVQIVGMNVINSLGKVPVLSWVPAVAGGAMVVGESILGMGGTALNASAQIATLTATASKAGGFAKLFGNSFKLATAPIKTAGKAIVGLGRAAVGGALTGMRNLGSGVLSFGKIAGGGILSGMKMLGSGVMMMGRSFIATLPAVWSFTASLLACPITWIVLGIIALAAGVFLIIKNWSVIVPWLKGLWEKITGIFKAGIGFFTSLPGIFLGIGKSILNFLLMPVNGGIGLLNKLKIKVPAWVPPPFGGKEFGFNIPKIPSFSKGVRNFGGGLAYVHQDELIDLPRGANVYTRSETRSILTNKQTSGGQGRSGDTYITLNFDSLIEKVGELENARDLLRIIGDLAGVAL